MTRLFRLINIFFFFFFFFNSFAQTYYGDYLTSDTIFYDDFINNKNQWPVGPSVDTTYTAKIEYGDFILTSNRQGSFPEYWTTRKIDMNKDFEIEVNLKYVKGEDNNALSLIWGKDENYNRFQFGISGYGEYVIRRYDGNWFTLKDWTSSNFINKSGYNKLTVRKIETEYYFFLNEKFVFQSDLYAFYGDQFGFQDNQNTTMKVDYLKACYLRLNPHLKRVSITMGDTKTDKPNSNEPKERIEVSLFADRFGNLHKIFDFDDKGLLCKQTDDIVTLDKPSEPIDPWTGVNQGVFYTSTDKEGKNGTEYGEISSQVDQLGFRWYTFKRKGAGENNIGTDGDNIWSINESGQKTKIGLAAYNNVITPQGEKETLFMYQLLNSDKGWVCVLGDKIFDGHFVQIGWVEWRVITLSEGKKVTILMTKGMSKNCRWTGRFNGIIYQDGSNEQTIKDIDGNLYHTVTIGTQTWMAENLQVTKFCDGTNIPLVSDSIDWANLNSSAYCNYMNNLTFAKTYGKLYNYFAIKDSRNVCPEGWHVPSDNEWQILVDYLGGEKVAGGKLKELGNIHWLDFGNGEASNISGFDALPGGSREFKEFVNGSSGVFDWLGMKGYFWSSTEWGDNYIWFRELQNGNPYVNRNHFNARCGFSIRCIKN